MSEMNKSDMNKNVKEDQALPEETGHKNKDRKPAAAPSAKEAKPKVDKRNKTLKRTAFVSVVLMIAIVITLNIILNAVVGKSWQFDWTANKAATIGDVTKQILGENTKDVKITVLADRDNYAKGFSSGDLSFIPKLLDEYASASKGKVTVDYVNPVNNPAIVKTIDPHNVHGLRENQIIVSNKDYSKIKVLNYQDLVQIQQYYVTGYVAEEVITGAIRFVTSDFTPVVYLTTGHGETGMDKDFTILKMLLEQNNYMVKDFDSLVASEVPKDAELLLMISPKNDISAAEEETYMKFLKKGGSLMVLADYSTNEFDNLNKLLREFDLKLTTDKIQENDTQKAFSGDPSAFVATIDESKLYKQNGKIDFAVVADARAVTTADSKQQWIKTQPVLTTSEQATRLIGGDKQNASQAGKQNIAMYSENTGFMDGSTVTRPAKVAVFGTSVCFTDGILMNYMKSAGNYLLANSALSYMSNMAEHASSHSLLIQPKAVVSYALAPNSQGAAQVLAIVFMGVVPLALIITAVVVYQKRKRL